VKKRNAIIYMLLSPLPSIFYDLNEAPEDALEVLTGFVTLQRQRARLVKAERCSPLL
jgi:hypothetical protein